MLQNPVILNDGLDGISILKSNVLQVLEGNPVLAKLSFLIVVDLRIARSVRDIFISFVSEVWKLRFKSLTLYYIDRARKDLSLLCRIVMEKYRQYRMMKKVKKLLNTPVQQEEEYTPSASLYVSDKTAIREETVLDPDRLWRMEHVEAAARFLLIQIALLDGLRTGVRSQITSGGTSSFDGISRGIGILFEELDRGVLLTEAEKDNQIFGDVNFTPVSNCNEKANSIDLGAMSIQVQDWQKEKTRRRKKLLRLENSIRELSLNVNDARCTQIARDRKTSAAALESIVRMGIVLLKDVSRNVQIARMTFGTTS